MTARRSLTTGQLTWWAALGFGAGFLTGMVAAELAGEALPERVGRSLRRGARVRPLPPRAAALEAAAALRELTDPAGLEIEPVGVAAGTVELRGWVSSRSERARAARAVQSAPGIERVVNRILVRGEDDVPDAPLPEDLSAADQSA